MEVQQPIGESNNGQKKEELNKIIVIVVIVVIMIGIFNKQSNNNQQPVVQEAKKETKIEYKIVKKDVYDATMDYVTKAQSQKQGFWKTLGNTPFFKEERLIVLISNDLDGDAVKETVRKIYKDETEGDDRLDRITVTAYNNKEYVETDANYVTHSYWESDEFGQTNNAKDDKDIIAGGQITWSYIHVRSSKKFIPASEVSDQERKIFDRFVELSSNLPILALTDKEGMEKQYKTVYEKLGKEFGLTSDELRAVVDKVSESVPSDFEKKVSDALQKEFDDHWNKTKELMTDKEENTAVANVAKIYNVSKSHVSRYYWRVNDWKINR